jgi:hypothetical protein
MDTITTWLRAGAGDGTTGSAEGSAALWPPHAKADAASNTASTGEAARRRPEGRRRLNAGPLIEVFDAARSEA